MDVSKSHDDANLDTAYRRAFPRLVTVAGSIWLSLGGGILLLALLGLTVYVAGSELSRLAVGVGCCASLIVALFGVTFLVAGVRTVRGTAPDTLANGIASILLGALFAVLALLEMQARRPRAGELLLAIVGFILAGVLMAAGILALGGRRDYQAWQHARPSPLVDRRQHPVAAVPNRDP